MCVSENSLKRTVTASIGHAILGGVALSNELPDYLLIPGGVHVQSLGE